MAMRIPASQRTREELTALIEGRLSTASAKDELVKLATRLILEETLEGEAGDAIGRDYYEHGAQPGQGYRNGYRTGRRESAHVRCTSRCRLRANRWDNRPDITYGLGTSLDQGPIDGNPPNFIGLAF